MAKGVRMFPPDSGTKGTSMGSASREISMGSVAIEDPRGSVRGVWSDVPPAPTGDIDELTPLRSAELEVLEVLGMSPVKRPPPPPPPKSARVAKRAPRETGPDPDAGESWMQQGMLSAPPIPREALDLDEVIETLSERPPAPITFEPSELETPPSLAISSLPPLPAPIVTPRTHETRRAPLLAGAVGFALGVAATLAFVFGFRASDVDPVAGSPVGSAQEPSAQREPAPAAVVAEPVVEEPTLAEPEPMEAEPAELAAPTAVEEAAPAVHVHEEPGTLATFERPARDARPVARPATTPRATPEATPATTPQATPEAPAVATAPAPARTLPAQPSRDAVEAAIASVSEPMRECAPGYAHQVAMVRFSFASNGRVTSAVVPPDFAGPQQRSCVARAARAARVPPFSAERLDVSYPVTF